MNHSVSDFIIRIKNASLARRKSVVLPYSRLNKAIGNVLVTEKFLDDIQEEETDKKKVLTAVIRYERRTPVLTDVIIFSKPSLRIYSEAKNIQTVVKRGRGIAILSTSSGVMTAKDAQKKGVGGEVLFKIW